MATEQRKIVVTGASGNVGSGVLRALAAAMPLDQIVGVCRRPPAAGSSGAPVCWHSVDLSKAGAAEALGPAMQGADVVIHLALAVRPVDDEEYLYRANVCGTREVLRAIADAGVGHLIYASSLAVYASGATEPVDEGWPESGQCTSLYSRHKVLAEKLVDEFAEAHPQVVVARIRPTLVVQRESAWQVRSLYLGPFLPRMLLTLLRHRVLPFLPLPAGLALQFVHADDVGNAVVRLLRTKAQGPFNLAADSLDIRGLAGLVSRIPIAVQPIIFRTLVTVLHVAGVVAVTPGWYDVAVSSPLMNTSRAREELGWSPSHSSSECAVELLDGLIQESAGPTAATGATTDDRTRLRRASDTVHDASLRVWTAAVLARAVGIGRFGSSDAVVIATNLIAGTPAAVSRLQARRRDAVAVFAPVTVVAAVLATVRGGWAPVAFATILNVFAAAERREFKNPAEQTDWAISGRRDEGEPDAR